MSDIVDRLRGLADLFEAQHAPHNLVLHVRAGADEIERLRAGGCARDQGTTQYCAEAAKMAVEIASLLNTLADTRTENMRLRKEMERMAAQVIEAEKYNGWHQQACLENERLRAALGEAIEFADQDYHVLTPTGEAMIARWRAALNGEGWEGL